MATLDSARTLVVKIGSALLVDAASGKLREEWLKSLADDVATLRTRGTQVILVSSGSIALGRRVLELPDGPLALEQAQAAASVGQIQLARAYENALAPHGITTGQILVTLEDSADRRRYLNARATMQTLLALGVTPIVNENDSIATDEIRYGDNDRLAAQVAVLAGADQLILLSDVDGLYTANPNVNAAAEHIGTVQKITAEIEAMAGEGTSGLSKGGMITKLMAAKIATEAGCAMAITLGTPHNPLSTMGRATWFTPQSDPQTARKAWIAAMKPRGALSIDTGAVAALHKGKSLLPAGVSAVSGQFGRGDPVSITAPDGQVIATGLARYTAAEARLIAGHQSADIEATLGYKGRAALVHRDDMILQSRLAKNT